MFLHIPIQTLSQPLEFVTNYFTVRAFFLKLGNLIIDEIFNFCHLTIKVIKFCALGNHLPNPE